MIESCMQYISAQSSTYVIHNRGDETLPWHNIPIQITILFAVVVIVFLMVKWKRKQSKKTIIVQCTRTWEISVITLKLIEFCKDWCLVYSFVLYIIFFTPKSLNYLSSDSKITKQTVRCNEVSVLSGCS